MKDWYQTEATYYQQADKVTELCKQHFGIEHKVKPSAVVKKIHDNHGNWEWRGGKIKFRYKKDYMWFMLMASNLVDLPREILPRRGTLR